MTINWSTLAIGAIVIGGVAVSISKVSLNPSMGAASMMLSTNTQVIVRVPDSLSTAAQRGRIVFNANCAQCHGKTAGGTDKGPPFIHQIYNPGHHADQAFFLAAQNGVRAHHWSFGDMPPQPQVGTKDIADIVTFVRELQTANGIHYQPHNM
jgi:mono/diheme cytochrome c family protein